MNRREFLGSGGRLFAAAAALGGLEACTQKEELPIEDTGPIEYAEARAFGDTGYVGDRIRLEVNVYLDFGTMEEIEPSYLNDMAEIYYIKDGVEEKLDARWEKNEQGLPFLRSIFTPKSKIPVGGQLEFRLNRDFPDGTRIHNKRMKISYKSNLPEKYQF